MDLINAGTLIGLAVLVIGYGAVSQYDLQISGLGAHNPDRWRKTVWFGSIILILYCLLLYPLLYWWSPHLSWNISDMSYFSEWVPVWILVLIAGFILPRYAGRYVGRYMKHKAEKLFEDSDKAMHQNEDGGQIYLPA